MRAGFSVHYKDRLLDLGFLIHHMFTGNGIIFLDLHLAGHVLFVFISGVEMPRSFGRYQADFISC